MKNSTDELNNWQDFDGIDVDCECDQHHCPHEHSSMPSLGIVVRMIEYYEGLELRGY
jgi:hypothetical protein